jgi:dipeptidyl aminopeptidase/acylaminoacyl peptidase
MSAINFSALTSIRPEFRPLTDEIFGGSPDQVPEKYYNASPINFVQHIVGRLLIIQGMHDTNVYLVINELGYNRLI